MNATALFLTFLLLLAADIPRATRLRPADSSPNPEFSNTELPLFPTGPDGESQNQAPAAPQGPRKPTLQPNTKLELIRYVSGEFAKATKALPAGKEGFLLYVEKPLNQELLDRAVATHGYSEKHAESVRTPFRPRAVHERLLGGERYVHFADAMEPRRRR